MRAGIKVVGSPRILIPQANATSVQLRDDDGGYLLNLFAADLPLELVVDVASRVRMLGECTRLVINLVNELLEGRGSSSDKEVIQPSLRFRIVAFTDVRQDELFDASCRYAEKAHFVRHKRSSPLNATLDRSKLVRVEADDGGETILEHSVNEVCEARRKQLLFRY